VRGQRGGRGGGKTPARPGFFDFTEQPKM